jgi:predicted dehydrogenase
MSELRLGIIGLGEAGSRRLEAALRHPRVTVVATADPMGRAPGFIGKHYEFGRSLLRHDLDAVCVAVPNGIAPALVRDAREAGLHVLAEEPPARAAPELRWILAAGGEGVLRFGFNHRLHRSVQAAEELLAGGAIGGVLAVEATYERTRLGAPGSWRLDPRQAGGGVLLDQGIHLVDLLRWWLGPLLVQDRSIRGLPLETSVVATLSAGGVPVRLATRADADDCRFEVDFTGERGRLTLTGLHTASGAFAPECLRLEAGQVRAWAWADDPSWDRELDSFVRHALDDEDDGHGSVEDALAVLRVVDRLREPAGPVARM